MSDYNLCVVVGKLASTPTLDTDRKGVTRTVLALDVRQRDLATVRVNAFVYKEQAELAVKFLREGSTVLVSGRLEPGLNGKSVQVHALRLQFMDRKPVAVTS